MKRKLCLFTLLVALFGTLVFATACGEKTPSAVAGEEVGEYYCDVNNDEYLLTLTEKCEYDLVMGEVHKTGKYVPNGEELTLTIDKVAVAATYFNDAVTLTYDSETYHFIRKVDYTITFNSNGGTPVTSLTVRNGRSASKPDTVPTKSNGDVFVGWYTDTALKSPYDWNETVTSSFTLYARFVTPINPEYTVTFNVDGDEDAYEPVQTIGHMALNLPTPEKAGSTFVGWYVSAFNNAEKLTYQYDEQLLEGDTTLYAVWAGDAPVVSVYGSTISWTSLGTNVTYSIVVTNVTENETVLDTTSTQLSYTFDFSEKVAGEYEITVQGNNKTGKAYYMNKALAAVSYFEVAHNTLMFHGVESAERYLLYVTCGAINHHSEPVVILANQTLAYDFSECEVDGNGHIVFVVRAEAEGYIASESEEYVVTHVLGQVENVSVDEATQVLSWSEVTDATSYNVLIKKGEDVVVDVNVTSGLSYALKTLDKGAYDITVTPKARGWGSPAGTAVQYTKNTIATPTNLRANFTDSTIEWDEVAGATGYEVVIGSNAPTTVTETKVSFVGVSGTLSYDITVRAIAANASESSLASDALTVRFGELGETLRYQDGVVSWDPVFGVETYYFSVRYESENAQETQYTNIYEIDVKEYFTASGVYEFTLRVDNSDPITLSIRVYELSFDTQGADELLESLFLAVGDKVELPGADTLTRFGYEFDRWVTAANGGVTYTDSVYLDERDRTLYAYWTAEVFHVSFNLGAYGVSTDELTNGVDVEYRGSVQLPVPASIDATKGFAGWYDGTGEISYTGGDGLLPVYFQGDDITLYAKWVDILVFTPIRDGSNNITAYEVSKHDAINLTSIKTLHIPETYNGVRVTQVIDFTGCTKLEVIEIPDSVTFIFIATTESAFTGCTNLKEVRIYETSYNGPKYYFDVDGVLIYNNPNTGRQELKFYPKAREATTYEIPDGVQTLPANVIWDVEGLEEIIIPASVTLIETQAIGYSSAAFANSLRKITFKAAANGEQEAALEIHPNAFYNVRWIKYLTLPTRLADLNFYSMFGGSDADASLRFNPNNLESLTFVGESGLYQSTADGSVIKNIGGIEFELVFYPYGLEEFTLPTGFTITSIGENAVRGNTTLTSITIPSPVTNIGSYAFYGCTGVTSITFNGGKGDLELTIGDHAFYGVNNSALTAISLPGNLELVEENAFGDTKITTVELNSGATIVDGAFSSDSGSTSVTTLIIGAEVKDINFKAVFGSAVKNIEIDENHPYYSSENNIIYNKDFTEIVWANLGELGTKFEIRSTVARIGARAFAMLNSSDTAPSFTEVVIPASVTYIGDQAFYRYSSNATLKTVTFLEPENGAERAPLTFGKEVFYNCNGLTSFTFPEGTVEIGRELFVGANALTEVHFPASVELIATSLTETSANTSAEITKFGMFSETGTSVAVALRTITVADGNTHYSAISNVLYTLREEEGEYVEDELLYCAPSNSVTQIVIPNTVSFIWDRAFYSGYRLSNRNPVTSITFSSDTLATRKDADGNEVGLTIGVEAFANAWVLSSITLPVGTVSIGAGAFWYTGGTGLTSLTIPYTVTSIGDRAFYNTYITNYTFTDTPDGTTPVELRLEDGASVSYGTFYPYSSLSSYTLTLPERTTYIGQYVFAGASFGTVNIPSTVTEIAPRAFYMASTTKTVTFAADSQLQRIGTYAFYRSAIENITIPASVSYIGDVAFYTSSLKTVTIEDNSNLVSVGYSAFSSCSSLESFSFGANSKLTTIPVTMFEGCSKLSEITIPASVEEIGGNAFASAGLTSITFEQGSKLHIVGESAFKGAKFTSFSFPETEQEILLGSKILEGCTSLATVHISSQIRSLNGAFDGCSNISAVTVHEDNPIYVVEGAFLKNRATNDVILIFGTLSGRYVVPAGSSQIAASAFAGQSEITEVFIPRSVVRIGNYAFQNCVNLVKIEFEAGSALTSIGVGAFEGCSRLEEIDFTKTTQLTTLAEDDASYPASNTFSGCESLETIDLSKTRITVLPTNTFAGCTGITTLKLPGTLTTIKNETYANWSVSNISLTANMKVTELDLSNTSLTSLPKNCFQNSTTLQTVKLPGTLTSLGDYAFDACTSLTEIDLSNCGALTEINQYAFRGCSNLATVKLSSATKTVGQAAFQNCTSLETFDMSGLETVSYQAFYNTGFKKVTLPGSVTSWGAGTTSASATNGVFAACTQLKEVVFSSSMTTTPTFLGYMFANCTMLDTVTFEDGCGVTTLATYMFSGCTSLESVTLPESITTLSNYLFYNCSGLTEVDLSATQVTSFEANVFSGCKAIESFKFPAGVSSIPSSLFDGFESLQEVTLPANVTSIGNYAFRNCTSLTSITLPATLTATGLGSQVFSGCTELATVIFAPGSVVTTIPSYAFENCSSLTSITLPASVTTIDSSAFKGSGLTSITLSANLTVVGSSAFSGSALTSVTLACGDLKTSATGTTIPTGLFKDCVSLQTVVVTGSLTTIGESWFEGCTELVSVELNNVTTLGDYAFRNCAKLSEIDVSNVTDMGTGVFDGCTAYLETQGAEWHDGVLYLDNAPVSYDDEKIKEVNGVVVILDGITSIPANFFQNSAELKKITLPAELTTIGANAFQDCTALTTVTFSGNLVTTIGASAFEGCTALVEIDLTGLTKLTDINTRAFYGSGLVEVQTPEVEGTLNLYSYVFANCTSLKTLKLSTTTSLYSKDANYFIQNCSLDLFEFGKVENNGASFFTGASIKTIKIADGVEEFTISGASIRYLYQVSGVKFFVIPASVNSIGQYTFSTSYLPATVKICFIASEAATQATFEAKATGSWNTVLGYLSSYTVVYEYDPNAAPTLDGGIYYLYGDMTGYDDDAIKALGGTVTLKDNTKEIPAGLFKNSKELKEIVLPTSLTTIGASAFEGCTALTTVTGLENTSVKTISEGTFMGCTALSQITFPKSVITFDKNSFKGCTSLTTLDFDYDVLTSKHSGTVTIGISAFEGSGLITVTLPWSTGWFYVHDYAFKDCKSLKKITSFENMVFGSSYSSFSTGVFDGCTLNVFEIANNSYNKYPASAFENATIKAIKFVDGTTLINMNPVTGTGMSNQTHFGELLKVNGLERIIIPASVTTIGSSTVESLPSNVKVCFVGSDTDMSKFESSFPAGTQFEYGYVGDED